MNTKTIKQIIDLLDRLNSDNILTGNIDVTWHTKKIYITVFKDKWEAGKMIDNIDNFMFIIDPDNEKDALRISCWLMEMIIAKHFIKPTFTI